MMREPSDPAFSPNAETSRQIEQQELLRVLLEERPGDEEEGAGYAHAPTIFQRLRFPLECLGSIVFGVNIAVIAIVFNFVLFNYLLHMEF